MLLALRRGMKAMGAGTPYRLIAFPPSVDTETARWILSHHGIPFRELRQTPVGSALRTVRHLKKIPILLEPGRGAHSPSRPIADRLDAQAPECCLVPLDPELAKDVNGMWEEFNGGLGVWIAQWIYHDVLERPALARRLTRADTPAWQRALDSFLGPLPLLVMKLGLQLHRPETADRALARCRRTFARVEERLSDGRPYLAGRTFTLADLAFCACAAPLMLESMYGGTLPTESEVSPRLREVAREFRASAAGQFALRMYREHYDPIRVS